MKMENRSLIESYLYPSQMHKLEYMLENGKCEKTPAPGSHTYYEQDVLYIKYLQLIGHDREQIFEEWKKMFPYNTSNDEYNDIIFSKLYKKASSYRQKNRYDVVIYQSELDFINKQCVRRWMKEAYLIMLVKYKRDVANGNGRYQYMPYTKILRNTSLKNPRPNNIAALTDFFEKIGFMHLEYEEPDVPQEYAFRNWHDDELDDLDYKEEYYCFSLLQPQGGDIAFVVHYMGEQSKIIKHVSDESECQLCGKSFILSQTGYNARPICPECFQKQRAEDRHPNKQDRHLSKGDRHLNKDRSHHKGATTTKRVVFQ